MKNSSNSRYVSGGEASDSPRSPYERWEPAYSWPESERQKSIQQYRERWLNRPREKPPGPIGDGWIQPVVVIVLIAVLVAILYAIASM